MFSFVLRALLLVAVLGGLAAFVFGGIRVLADPEDLRAFYCAGKAVVSHRDPYLAEPLRTCEVRESRAAGLTPYNLLAVPAPLPGFAFVPFAALALLPFGAASSLFVLLVIGALVATGAFVREFCAPDAGRAPRWALVVVIGASLACSDGLTSVANGQIVPFAILALCASGFALKRGRYGWAAAFVALASIEPHVALPVWIALAFMVPQTRRPLAICAAALVAASIVTLGPAVNLEYLTAVLPAHAASEASASGQYSLATLLVRCGIAIAPALAVANVWFVALCALGIFTAQRLARKLDAPELAALVPPAFAVFGGPFVHLTQLAVAIPAILVLGSRLPRYRVAFAVALLLLALPWQDLAENPAPAVLGAIALVALPIALWFWRLRPVPALEVVTAMLALGALELQARALFARAPADATHSIALVAGDGRLAEETWTAFMSVAQDADMRWYLVSHIPTWAGLAIALAAMLRATRGVSNSARVRAWGPAGRTPPRF